MTAMEGEHTWPSIQEDRQKGEYVLLSTARVRLVAINGKSVTLNIKNLPIPKIPINLTHPDFKIRQDIDALIGTEFYNQLLAAGQSKLHKDLQTLQSTVFGWSISGRVKDNPRSNLWSARCRWAIQSNNRTILASWRTGSRLKDADTYGKGMWKPFQSNN